MRTNKWSIIFSERVPLSESAEKGNDDSKMRDGAARPETSTAAEILGASGIVSKAKTKATKKPTKTRSRSALPTGKARSRSSSPAR